MATATEPANPPIAPVEPAAGLFRISLDTYRQMGAAGLITRADRVELLDGLLVTKMTKGPRHVLSTLALMRWMTIHLPAGFHPRMEAPVELRRGPEGDSSPEPDLTVVRGAMTDYRDRHPAAADVLLVVEVADSSLRHDRQGLRRYAHAGIPTVWIVNLRAGTVEVYTDPSGPAADPGYATKATRAVGGVLDLSLDGHRLAGPPVADLLG